MSNISPLMDIGCDKVTYSNYCEARLSGIGRHKIGACSQIDSQHLSDPTNPKLMTGPSAKPYAKPSPKPSGQSSAIPTSKPSPKPSPKPSRKPK
jgi:hypothetical protein